MSTLPIMSVSGIRGIFGESLTPYLCSAIAYIQTKISGSGRVIIGRDTRPSGVEIEAAICRGVRAAGGIPISIGIAPTPTTCFAVKHFGAQAGIIITASHNPNPYNGYKMVHQDGRLFSDSECTALYEDFRNGLYPSEEKFMSYDDTPEETLNAVTPHVDRIVAAVDADAIRAANIVVGVDAINGAASAIFPLLLEKLGVQWQGVFCTTSGDFAHNPEPRPEHLKELALLLASTENTWCGLAYDPDADRLATMGENGEPISEEMTLVLSLENVLSTQKSDIATNLSTSMTIDDVARHFSVQVIRTKIGEANVVEAICANNLAIGGEGNGGIIYPKITTVRDALTGTALILELMAKKQKKITELVAQWKSYPIIKEKIPLGDTNPQELLSALTTQFTNENIDTQDGLKIIYEDGWVHLRASNTEAIMRCYAEAKTIERAQELVDMLIMAVEKLH